MHFSLMAFFSSSDRKMTIVSAGHNPLLHYQAGTRQLVKVNPAGMPLGVPVTLGQTFADSLEEIQITMQPGDLVFLYTDGITEAEDSDEEAIYRHLELPYIAPELREGRGEVEAAERGGNGLLAAPDLARYAEERAGTQEEAWARVVSLQVSPLGSSRTARQCSVPDVTWPHLLLP